MDMVEQAKKKDDFERFSKLRQRDGWLEYADNDKRFTEDEKTYATDYIKQKQAESAGSVGAFDTVLASNASSTQKVVNVALLEKLLAQKKQEEGHFSNGHSGDKPSPVAFGFHHRENGDTMDGAQEFEPEDNPMASSVATLLPSRTDTSVTALGTSQRLEVRPSWIKWPQREALQKTKEKAREREENYKEIEVLRQRTKTTLLSQEEPKKKDRTPEEIEKQKDAMQDLKDALEERYGDDGWYSYKMLGECYIHGMMDGEAMLLQNEGDPTDEKHTGHIPSVVFEIR